MDFDDVSARVWLRFYFEVNLPFLNKLLFQTGGGNRGRQGGVADCRIRWSDTKQVKEQHFMQQISGESKHHL